MTKFRLPVLLVVVLGLSVTACGRKGFLEEPLPPPQIGPDGKPKEQPDPKQHQVKPLMRNDQFILNKLL